MKTDLLDFLRCGLLLGVLLLADIAVLMAVAPRFRDWLGDYHVLATAASALLAHGILSALAIRILLALRPLRPGRYTLASPEFGYWKLLAVILLVGRWTLEPFTFCLTKPMVARLFGARIGRNVAIAGDIGEPYLLSVEDDAVLGVGSSVSGSVSGDGGFILAPVRIGRGATIGINTVVMAGTQVGANSSLASGAVAVPGSIIPDGESWRGNPARKWAAMPGPAPAQP